jgi:hypothetical protein
VVPLNAASTTLYVRAWRRAFPDQVPFGHLDLASYEHVAAGRADELETEVRRRLRRPDRVLGALTCASTHHGTPRPDCPYATAPTRSEGTTMSIACTSPLDAPHADSYGRTCGFFWPLTPVTDPHSGPGWEGVLLSAHHDRDRKRFFSSLHPTTVFANGTSRTSVSLMATPAWRTVQPVARYSAKLLDAFAEQALAGLRAAWTDGDPAVRALFTVSESATTIEKG